MVDAQGIDERRWQREVCEAVQCGHRVWDVFQWHKSHASQIPSCWDRDPDRIPTGCNALWRERGMGLARNHAAYFGTSSALAHCHPDRWDRLDKLAYSSLVYSGKFSSKYVFFVLFDHRAGFKLLAVRTIQSHWCGAAVYDPARMDKHLTGSCQHHPWIPVLRKPCRIDCNCHCRKPFRSAPKCFPAYCKIAPSPTAEYPCPDRDCDP